jgi:hypothetical protein
LKNHAEAIGDELEGFHPIVPEIPVPVSGGHPADFDAWVDLEGPQILLNTLLNFKKIWVFSFVPEDPDIRPTTFLP